MFERACIKTPVKTKALRPEAERFRKTMAQLLIDVRRHVGCVAGMLDGRDWLVGNAPTLADFAVYSMFGCLLDAPEVHEIFAGHPSVKTWMQRLADEAWPV